MTDVTCESGVCGTGTGNFPQPGDPDNNLILTATPAFGGVDVTWTYPGVNPQAVAHTILYRSTNPNFEDATRHAIVAGNFFYDKTTGSGNIRYYYWIQVVSVNGTYGGVIGPATAIARPLITQVIEELTEKIDNGMLAQSLKGEIDRITLNALALDQEILDRAEVDAALAAAFNQVEAHSEQTRALLQEELLARANGDSAVITQVNTIYAEMESRVSAIQRIQDALVDEMKAMASDMTSVEASLHGNTASGEVGLIAQVEKNADGLVQLGAQYTAKVQANGLIGGFGVYNDGTTVEAGFDVDRFWVGRTGSNKRKPFIIENDEVFIDQAVINKLTFSKLTNEDGSFVVEKGKLKADYLDLNLAKVYGALQSNDYKPNEKGWKLDKAGTFENNGSGTDGRMQQTNQFIKVFDAQGVKRVQMGNLSL